MIFPLTFLTWQIIIVIEQVRQTGRAVETVECVLIYLFPGQLFRNTFVVFGITEVHFCFNAHFLCSHIVLSSVSGICVNRLNND